jgi:hypothetical protein
MAQLAVDRGHADQGARWAALAHGQFEGLSMPYWQGSAAQLMA